MTQQRRRSEWANFVRDLLDGRYSKAEQVVLVTDQRNAAQAKANWHLTTDQARIKLRSLYPSFEN